ncbi:MAG: COG1361 S-layer family protein [Methanosarcinaceae archaeon]|nr:COG1361 S-layer family protein [Methanosarcinaceae archaeon]
MKRFLILLLMLALPITCASAATYVDASSINVDLVSQSPNPARPGETFELSVSVQNIGNENIDNIVVELEPEYPFSQVSGESLIRKISYLNARQEDNDATVLRFKLKVDADVPDDTYEIDVVVRDSTGTTKTIPLDIQVRGKEYAQIITISKARIDLAKEEPLELIITNIGNSPLQNMVVSWEEENGVILPVYSDNTKYIKYLDVGESITISYTIMADVNAVPGLYQIDISLEFEDYNSNTTVINTRAGLFVGGETDFDVTFSEGTGGEVSLSVANIGSNQAYSVKVEIPEQDNYRVTGSTASIVGNLDIGDYTIASFTLSTKNAPANMVGGAENSTVNVRGGIPSDVSVPNTASGSSGNDLIVIVEYTDSAGKRVSLEKSVPIELNSGTSAGFAAAGAARGNQNQSLLSNTSFTIPVLLLAIAGGVALYYRKKRSVGKKQ